MADNEIDVKIKASSDGSIADKIGETKSEISSLADGASEIVENFQGIAEAIAAAFAVDELEEFTKGMAELGEQVEHTAAITGQSVDQVQEFNNLVKGTGGSVDTASLALANLERHISEAAVGALPEAADAFERLGVSQTELARGNLNEIMETMARTMHDTADGANKVDAMYKTIGRSGAQLIPIFDLGEDGIKRLNAAFEETGANLSEGFADKLEALAQQLYLSEAATQGEKNALMSDLLPAVSAAAVGLTQLKEMFTANIKEGSGLAEVIKFFGAVIDGVVAAVEILSTAFTQLFDVASGVIKSLDDQMKGFGDVMYDIATGKLKNVLSDLSSASTKAGADLTKGLTDADAAGEKLKQNLTQMMDVYQGIQRAGVGAGRGNAEKPFAPPTAKDDTADDASKQRQLEAEKYDTEKEYDNLRVQSGQMTNDQKFADLQEALSKEKAAVLQSFDDQMAEYDRDSIEYQKLQDEKLIAIQKFTIESMKLTQEQTKDQEKEWLSAVNTINKSFDTMMVGILQGTQTVQQAFARMAGNMIITFMEAIAKILIENALLFAAQQLGFTQASAALSKDLGQWVLTENAKTAATVTGDAARTASNQAAAAASESSGSAAASKSIMQDAYEAAANVYANVSAIPYVGWILAPPAAAAAFGAVAAYDSFAVGTPYVPHDMLAQIHEGERIITAADNKKIENGQSDLGGGDTHIHIHAMDSRDVKRFAQQHGAVFAKAVSSSIRSGNRAFAQHI